MKRFWALLTTALMLMTTVGVLTVSADALSTTATNQSITKLAGEVEIPFNANLVAKGLADKVTLTRDNVTIPISVSLKAGDAKTIVVRYGELAENTAYTLTIKQGLTSEDGDLTLAADIPITLTTDKSHYIVKEDFQSYSVGDTIDINSIAAPMNNNFIGSGTIKNDTDDTDYQYLEIPANSNVCIGATFDAITDDFAMELELAVSQLGASSQFRWSRKTGGNAGSTNEETILPIFQPWSEYYPKQWFPWEDTNDTFRQNPRYTIYSITPQEDKHGMQVGKIVCSKNAAGDSFDLELSDGTTSTYAPMTGFHQFTAFRLDAYTSATPAKIGKMYLYRISPLKVLTSGYSEDKTSYDIVMTDDVASFGSNSYLTQANYNAATRTFSIDATTVGDGITVSLEGLRSDDGAYSYDTLFVGQSVEALEIEEAVPDSMSVMAVGSTIEIPCTAAVDETSLAGKVTMSDSSGNNVPIIVGTKAKGKTITAFYGKLQENQTYTLTIAKGIASADNALFLDKGKNITLTTDKSNYIVKEDFTRFDVGTDLATSYSGDMIIETAGGTVKEINDDKYMEMTGNTYIKKAFDPITEDFAMEIKLDAKVATGNSLQWSRSLPSESTYGGTGGGADPEVFVPIAMPWTFGNLWFPWYVRPSDYSFGPTSMNYQTDYAILPDEEDGMQFGKVVASKNEDGSTFDIETTSGDKVGLTDMKGFDMLTAFELQLRPNAGNPKLSKMYLYRITPLKVLTHGLSADETTYNIVMSDDIGKFGTDPYLTQANYDSATKTFKIPTANLGNKDITVSLSGMRTKEGAFSYDTVTFTPPQKAVTFSAFNTSSMGVTATLSQALADQTPLTVIALYNAGGNLLQTAFNTTITFDSSITLETGYVLKCFVLDNAVNLKPLTADGAIGVVCQPAS